MTNDIQQRIDELQAQRAAAEQAERARLDAEQENRATIAETDAEINRLREQQAVQGFTDAEQHHGDLLATNADIAAALWGHLDALFVAIDDALGDDLKAATGTLASSQDDIQQNARAAESYLSRLAAVRAHLADDDAAAKVAMLHVQRDYDHRLRAMRYDHPGYDLRRAVVEWVTKAAGGDEQSRRIARAVGVILTGVDIGTGLVINQGVTPSVPPSE